MSNFSHRIRKLRWIVSTDSLAEAFTIRKCLHEQWQELLLSACERAFDEAVNGKNTIHIPKLEINLKVTSEQELMEVLPELIQQQLKERLQSINWQTIPTTQSEFIWQETTTEQDQFATLVQYLQTASVPWQVAYASASEIAIELKETCRKERSQLINYLSNQPETVPFYFRLLQLLPEAEYLVLANALSDKFSLELRTAITEFMRFLLYSKNNALNQPTQWQLVATILSECSSRVDEQIRADFRAIVAKIIAETGSDRGAFFCSLPSSVAVLFRPQSNSERTSTPAANLPAFENPKTTASGNEATRSPLNPDAISLFENRDKLSNRENDLSNYVLNPAGEITSTGDDFPLSVNYAGLVLLHPFISPFFEATGVKETGNKAIADSKIARAAALLHFLATGQEELHEYELGLIKILLGLEPKTPLLVGEGLLQEGDREEAEAVLQSVINYWSVLKSTSIEGLRSSFLQRSGLLRRADNGWSLQVEHQSFDMLLEHLPWSISIIKLSWMKRPLYTEWQTF